VDKFTFIAEMTKALAWPVVVVVVAMIARKPIGLLIAGLRLQKMKGAGWEFEFGQLEARVQHVVAELPPVADRAPPAEPKIVVGGDDASALAIILTTWAAIEATVREAAQVVLGESDDKEPFGRVLNDLLQTGAVRPGTVDALRGLEALRNLAAHAPKDEALEPRMPHFTAMAQALQWNLDRDYDPISPRGRGNHDRRLVQRYDLRKRLISGC